LRIVYLHNSGANSVFFKEIRVFDRSSDDQQSTDAKQESDVARTGEPPRNESWADEGTPQRAVVFERHNFDFENAVDVEKVEAVLAWNRKR
jgi:hypothetical protein